MKNAAVLLVVLRIGLLQVWGQQFHTAGEPETLATVSLQPAVRRNIERVVFDFVDVPAKERSAEATQIPFDRLTLRPHGRWVWHAMAPDDFCGSHAKCEYWLFDPATEASLVEDALGSELDVLDTRHNDWRDLMTSGYDSYCEKVTVYYQFDGRKYRGVRTVSDTSACDPDSP